MTLAYIATLDLFQKVMAT